MVKNHIVEPSHDEKSRTTPLCFSRQPNWHLDANSQCPTQSSPWEPLRKASANYSIVSSTTLLKVELESRCQFPMAHSIFPLGSPQESIRKWREPRAKSAQKPHSVSIGEKSTYSIVSSTTCSKSNWNLDANSQWPTQTSPWEALRKASANGVSQEPKVLKNNIVEPSQ